MQSGESGELQVPEGGLDPRVGARHVPDAQHCLPVPTCTGTLQPATHSHACISHPLLLGTFLIGTPQNLVFMYGHKLQCLWCIRQSGSGWHARRNNIATLPLMPRNARGSLAIVACHHQALKIYGPHSPGGPVGPDTPVAPVSPVSPVTYEGIPIGSNSKQLAYLADDDL